MIKCVLRISLPFENAYDETDHKPVIAAPAARPTKQDVPNVKAAPTPQVTAPTVVAAAEHPTATPVDVPILHASTSQAVAKYGNITTIRH